MRVLMTGGTGFIGKAFIGALSPEDHATVLSRYPASDTASCRYITRFSEVQNHEKFDVVINLAGSPIDRRWTAHVKNDLVQSRVNTTEALVNTLSRLENKPKLLISASAIGFYGNDHDQVVTESTAPHPGFTHHLCQLWEAAAMAAKQNLSIPVAIVRLGVVLGKEGGYLKKVSTAFRFGMGARISDGASPFPWIHIDDVVKSFMAIIQGTSPEGVYNLVAPANDTNATMTQAMSKQFHRRVRLSMPATIIKLLFGEMGEELLLKGCSVQPKRLIDEGFSFSYPDIESALQATYS